MDKLQIQGGVPLEGEVRISGRQERDAADPRRGAARATSPVVVANVPHLKDVTTTVELLGRMGATVTIDERMRIEVDGSTLRECFAPYELVKTMRASILVLGPLVARYGRADVSLPGGCAIGARPVNIHVAGLQAMGADITIEGGYIRARAARLKGARLVLDTVTVTGTENLMMAATLADGETVIENAAREPEVVDLANFLIAMGAKIQGAGTDKIVIEGVQRLHGTALRGAARSHRERHLPGRRRHHRRARAHQEHAPGAPRCGARQARGGRRAQSACGDNWVEVDMRGRTLEGGRRAHRAVPGASRPTCRRSSPPSTPSPPASAPSPRRSSRIASCTCWRCGAWARRSASRATPRSSTAWRKLTAAPVMATDLRASASLVLAGLVAEGRTEVERIYHIDRGYEAIEEKLAQLGAQIRRVPN